MITNKFLTPITTAMAAMALMLSGCNSIAERIGLEPTPDPREVCKGIEAPEEVKTTGKRIACETYAGLLQYEGIAVAAESVIDDALVSTDDDLKRFGVQLGKLDAKASPAAVLTNRALDRFVYLDGKTREVMDSEDKVAASLDAAADAYVELNAAWRDAKPDIEALKSAWGRKPADAPQ